MRAGPSTQAAALYEEWEERALSPAASQQDDGTAPDDGIFISADELCTLQQWAEDRNRLSSRAQEAEVELEQLRDRLAALRTPWLRHL